MYAIGYFYGPWEDGTPTGGGGGGTGTGTGLTDEQKTLLDEMKLFSDIMVTPTRPLHTVFQDMVFDSEMGAQLGVQLTNWKNIVPATLTNLTTGGTAWQTLLDNAASGAQATTQSQPVYQWWTDAVPDVYKKLPTDPNSARAKAHWESLLTRSDVQDNALASASAANPDNTMLTIGDLLPYEAWKSEMITWKGITDMWRAAIDQWKSDTNAEVIHVTDAPNTFFCRLRPPNRKVRANALYVVTGTGHYSTSSYELFYFRLITHGPNMDALASKAFQFMIFNNSTTFSCRITCNNTLGMLQPVVFVRGTVVSKSIGNTIIGPRQGVRFTFVPLEFSTYTKDGRICPAFIEEDVFINTSQTLLPPSNINYDFSGVEAGLPP